MGFVRYDGDFQGESRLMSLSEMVPTRFFIRGGTVPVIKLDRKEDPELPGQ